MNVQDRVAIVSGGASGLGEATVRMLAARGAKVCIVDRDEARGAALASELGASACFARADVAEAAEADAAVTLALERYSRLDVAVNCAGIATAQKVLDRDSNAAGLDTFAKVVRVNLIGTFNVVRLAAAAMARNAPSADAERGVIVNTASIAAFDGQIGQAAYAASKAGIAGMTLPLARELARHGIRVVTIAPGVFETPLMAQMPDAVRTALAASIPFPARLGKPDEFASLVCHAIENTMLNGEVIRLDGALRMPPK